MGSSSSPASPARAAELKKFLLDHREQPLFRTMPPVVFLDEIHRFNKAQQDILLPFLERGEAILIGATTENPAFYLNPALRSRCQVIALKPLTARGHPDGAHPGLGPGTCRAAGTGGPDGLAVPLGGRGPAGGAHGPGDLAAHGGVRTGISPGSRRPWGAASPTTGPTATTTWPAPSRRACGARDADAALYYLSPHDPGRRGSALHRPAAHGLRRRGCGQCRSPGLPPGGGRQPGRGADRLARGPDPPRPGGHLRGQRPQEQRHRPGHRRGHGARRTTPSPRASRTPTPAPAARPAGARATSTPIRTMTGPRPSCPWRSADRPSTIRGGPRSGAGGTGRSRTPKALCRALGGLGP